LETNNKIKIKINYFLISGSVFAQLLILGQSVCTQFKEFLVQFIFYDADAQWHIFHCLLMSSSVVKAKT
jgi:hypothetical protein